MTEPTRDELAERAADDLKFADFYGVTKPVAVSAFKAGWDAAVEQLSRPDIIDPCAQVMLNAFDDLIGWHDPTVYDGDREVMRLVLAEVARVLGREVEG